MRIPDEQITTAEVKAWKGLHLLHFQASSCSQKVRMVLEEKRIPWESREIDLTAGAQHDPAYVKLNPNHVVPTLVHDGAVLIESSLINNTMLVQIAILAWLFLGEPIGAREAVGLILAMLGVLLVQLPAASSNEP